MALFLWVLHEIPQVLVTGVLDQVHGTVDAGPGDLHHRLFGGLVDVGQFLWLPADSPDGWQLLRKVLGGHLQLDGLADCWVVQGWTFAA